MLGFYRNKSRQVPELPQSVGEKHVSLRQYLGEGLFLLSNGDIAITYEIEGIADETLTEEELAAALQPLRKFVQTMLRGVPVHREDGSTVVQIICSQRPAKISKDTASTDTNEALQLIRSEEKHLYNGGLVNRRFFLTIRWARPQQASLTSGIRAASRALGYSGSVNETRQSLTADIALFKRELCNKAIEAGISLRTVNDEEVVTYYTSVLARGEAPRYTLAKDRHTPLNKKIFTPKVGATAEGFNYDPGNTRLFTFLDFPTIFALGRFRLFIDGLPLDRFELVLTLSHSAKKTSTDFLLKKLFFSQGPSHQKKYEDLLEVESEIDIANPLVRLSSRLIAYDVDDELESKILSCGFDYINAPIIREEQIAPHLISSSLPMNCPQSDHTIIGRYRTALLDRALMFAPIYTSSASGGGMRHWSSRAGEPVSMDFFKGSGNNHMVVLGNSESGKSALTAQFILEFMARFPTAVIRVVDRKTSYGKLCDLHNGKVVQFSEKHLREYPYSPFSFDCWDDDDVQNTVVFIANAIAQLNPDAIITGLHTELLSEAIKICANNHEKNLSYKSSTGGAIDPHPTWIDIEKALPVAAANKNSGQEFVEQALADLRRWSISFTPSGQYGFLFCSHEHENARSDGAQLIVYDLDGIADPRLQMIASQLAFLKISRDLKKLERDTRKLLIFEELGVLLRGDSKLTDELATRFVRNVVKTARKIGAQAVGISNELSDFTETEGGQAFFRIAPQKLFLPQSSSTKSDIETSLAKELSRSDIDIIKSLHIKKGYYSQGYLISQTDRFRSSFLIPLSPSMNAIVTTDAKEESCYSKLRDQGLSAHEALAEMVKTYPYGEGL